MARTNLAFSLLVVLISCSASAEQPTTGDFSAKSSDIAIEEIELAHEGLQRE